MIFFDKIGKVYPNNKESLQNVSIKIEDGEMMFITGHSGAGKSTFLKLIARLEMATSGSIYINNQDISKIKRRELPFYRRKIGYIYQNHLLLPYKTVFENVALPLKIQGANSIDINKRVRAALTKLGLFGYRDILPTNLSEGEQQRVGIARAVVHRPSFLLADEPTGNLDTKLSIETMKLFKQFNQIGVTVLISTHDEALINKFNVRNIELKQGRIIRDSHA